jgi:peroxiredoxin
MRNSRTSAGTGVCVLLVPVACLLLAAPVRALEAGDRAPSFSARSLDGDGTLSLGAYKGEVVYVDFWASWCPPCLTSLPLLEKLRQELDGQGFRVLAINVDKDPEKARRFLEKRPVGYPSVSDPKGRLPETFGLATMPTSYLIDRRGVVRYVHQGFRDGDIDGIRERVRALLGESK